MSLSVWLANRWIHEHSTTAEEIESLFAVVDRDLTDAAIPRLSDDWRLGITYNAALQLATIALAVSGHRAARERHHERTILSLRFTIGATEGTVDLLDLTRRKRNHANYEAAGSTSSQEAQELFDAVNALREQVVTWLRTNHPDYAD
jgi:hypothetical protein